MIKSVGQMVSSSVDLAKVREGGKSKAASAVSEAGSSKTSSVSASPASQMAASGAPVDMDRVAAIKDAIASGNYPVDANRIAQSMIDLDLGE